MSQPFVSVLTPTYNRRKFIPHAIQMFRSQTYPHNRMEWIVVDDGEEKVGDLFETAGLPNVRYMALDKKLTIGKKRNFLNSLAKGEICVCMDDDDYYPPDRVRQAVLRLTSQPKPRRVLVTGASEIYLYFTDTQEIWKAGPYGPYHCTNGTMAYFKEYTKTHSYEEHAEKAEEKKYLDGFTAPVFQLNGRETMLVICHSRNTVEKRKLLQQENPLLKKTSMRLKDFVRYKPLRDFYLSLKDEYVSTEPAQESVPAPAPAPAELVVTSVSPEIKLF